MPEYRLVKYRGNYAVAYQGENGIIRRSLGTSEIAEAKAAFDDFVIRLDKPKVVTIGYLWAKYREDKAEKRIASNMVFSGKAILPEFTDVLPDHIDAAKCRAYVAKRRKMGRQDGTIWTELNHLRIVMNWALKKRLVKVIGDVETPRKPDPKDRRLTRAEAKRLLDAAEPAHIKVAITLMLGTAARSGAILQLTWPQVDFKTGLITYRDPEDDAHRKGRATVPMTKQVRVELEKAKKMALSEFVVEWSGKPVKSIKRGFGASVERAGLADVSPHVLRHSAATFMAEAGVSMEKIAAVLGHSDSSITEKVYAKFSPTYLKSAVDALDLSDDEESGVPSCADELDDEPLK